jgi:hypothetical protein
VTAKTGDIVFPAGYPRTFRASPKPRYAKSPDFSGLFALPKSSHTQKNQSGIPIPLKGETPPFDLGSARSREETSACRLRRVPNRGMFWKLKLAFLRSVTYSHPAERRPLVKI